MLSRNPFIRRQSGFTLVETSVAIGLVGMFIAILIVMSSNVLGLLRSAKDNISASQTLQERVENVRPLNWLQLTSGAMISSRAMAIASPSTQNLSQCVETVTVSAHPPKANFAPVKVVRQNGAVQIVSDNPSLQYERMARVEVSVKWFGFPNSRQHERVTTSMISRVGSTK